MIRFIYFIVFLSFNYSVIAQTIEQPLRFIKNIHHGIFFTGDTTYKYSKIIDSRGNFQIYSGFIDSLDLDRRDVFGMEMDIWGDKGHSIRRYHFQSKIDTLYSFYERSKKSYKQVNKKSNQKTNYDLQLLVRDVVKNGKPYTNSIKNLPMLVTDILYNEILRAIGEKIDTNSIYLLFEVTRLITKKNIKSARKSNLARYFVLNKLSKQSLSNNNFHQYYIESTSYEGVKLIDVKSTYVLEKKLNKIFQETNRIISLVEKNEDCISSGASILMIIGGKPFVCSLYCATNKKKIRLITNFESKIFGVAKIRKLIKENNFIMDTAEPIEEVLITY